MKFSHIKKNQTITYRLCDELTCRNIAMHTIGNDDPHPTTMKEFHLCDKHYSIYKAELKDAVESNS